MALHPNLPPEAFTEAHSLDRDDSPSEDYWLDVHNGRGALQREADTTAALDAAGVPALVPTAPGVRSSFPADRVRWLASQVRADREREG